MAATLAVSVAAAVAGQKVSRALHSFILSYLWPANQSSGPYILSFFHPRILRVPMDFGKDLVFERMEGFISLG